MFDFSTNTWTSTFTYGQENNLTKFTIARSNHACSKFVEDGKVKVMIAGGVIWDNGGYRTTNSTEILDFESLTWIFGYHLPQPITGAKFLDINGRPSLLGRQGQKATAICQHLLRYGDHKQKSLLRYEAKKYWTELLVKPSYGRSDFQIIQNIPDTFSAKPRYFSKYTKINPGDCSVINWKNTLKSYFNGKKIILATPKQIDPWIQINMGKELLITEVDIQ